MKHSALVLLFVVCLALLGSGVLCAQTVQQSASEVQTQIGEVSITGVVGEEDSSNLIAQAAVQLLTAADSTMIDGVVTDSDGRFTLKAPSGRYILKISCLSFVTLYKPLSVNAGKTDINLGLLNLTSDSIWLQSAVVAAAAQPITVIADTVVYNAAAFKVGDDALLEDLLKKIPGLEIDGSGNVILQGKEVKQLLVNGKRFFGGDVKTGLKNLTADMVENIRAYERESEFARLSGVDDGEQEPVLDISIKKSMMQGIHNNMNLGGGTEKKYAARVSSNRITKKDQFSVIANVNDIGGRPSMNNTSRSQLGSGNSGDIQNRDAGFTFSKDMKNLIMEGHAQYTGNSRDARNDNRSESIYSSSTSWSNSQSVTDSQNNTLKSDISLEWRPNSKWVFYLKPVFNYRADRSISNSVGSSFNADPYELVLDPSQYLRYKELDSDDPLRPIRVNCSDNKSISSNDRLDASVTASATARNVGKKGRSISFRLQGSYNDSPSESISDYLTRYYRIKKNPDSVLVRRYYTESSSTCKTISGQVTWNEPLGTVKGLYLQGSYRLEYRKYAMTRDLYHWTDESNLKSQRQDDMCSEGTYSFFNHTATASLRYVKNKVNCTVGVNFRPMSYTLSYPTDGGIESYKGSYLYVIPNVTMRFKQKKSVQWSLVYSGWPTVPSLYNLLPVVNGTNPTYVHYGNPNLKQSFTHRVQFSYNASDIKRQNSLVCHLEAYLYQDNQSNSTVYDPETGIRTVTPQNIQGNWNVSGNTTFNKTLPDNRFSISNHASASYQNSSAYLYNSKLKEDEVNVIHRFMGKEVFDFMFRNEWLELMANAGGEYTSEESLLRPVMNQQPYAMRTGASLTLIAPWKMRFESDATLFAQRGYTYNELNKNYYIVNVSLSQTVLKKKGTVKLEWNDILHSQENLVRTFTSERRSIATFNGVNSYIMLRFIYRFKL